MVFFYIIHLIIPTSSVIAQNEKEKKYFQFPSLIKEVTILGQIGGHNILGRQSLSNQIAIQPVSQKALVLYFILCQFKSTVNAETCQSVIKMIKQITGPITGKNVFYKTIAHKNTTSLNNHRHLTAHITMCKLVQSVIAVSS